MALKRNLIANYIGQIWSALMGLVFIPQYIKYLGVESYGLLGFFVVLQTWLGLLDMGMTPALSREMARFSGEKHSTDSIRDLLRSIELIALALALTTAIGVYASSNWIAKSWLRAETIPLNEVSQAITITGTVIALRFMDGVYRSAIVGLQRQVFLNVVNSAMATVRGIGAIGILAWVSPTIAAFLLWQVAVSAATVGVLGAATYSSIPRSTRSGQFSVDAIRSIGRFASGMIGITVLAALLSQVDKVILAKIVPLREFGYYSLAGTVAGSLTMLIGPVTQSIYPKYCELHARGDVAGLIESYHKGAQIVSVIAGSAAVTLVAFAEAFLHLWTGDVALAVRTTPLLRILLIGSLLNGLMWIPYHAQLAHGWTGLTVRINIVAVLFIVPAMLWAATRYGAIGAGWVWVILNIGYITIAVNFMYRRILTAERWRWYCQDVMIPLAASLTVAAAARVACPSPESTREQIAVLGLTSLLSLIASGLASSYLRQQARHFLKPYAVKLGFHLHLG